jgi:hypothetical protein
VGVPPDGRLLSLNVPKAPQEADESGARRTD